MPARAFTVGGGPASVTLDSVAYPRSNIGTLTLYCDNQEAGGIIQALNGATIGPVIVTNTIDGTSFSATGVTGAFDFSGCTLTNATLVFNDCAQLPTIPVGTSYYSAGGTSSTLTLDLGANLLTTALSEGVFSVITVSCASITNITISPAATFTAAADSAWDFTGTSVTGPNTNTFTDFLCQVLNINSFNAAVLPTALAISIPNSSTVPESAQIQFTPATGAADGDYFAVFGSAGLYLAYWGSTPPTLPARWGTPAQSFEQPITDNSATDLTNLLDFVNGTGTEWVPDVTDGTLTATDSTTAAPAPIFSGSFFDGAVSAFGIPASYAVTISSPA